MMLKESNTPLVCVDKRSMISSSFEFWLKLKLIPLWLTFVTVILSARSNVILFRSSLATK